jgi:hypothetical protein
MNPVSRYWLSICFKAIAALCFIGLFIAFMKLQERDSELHHLRTVGVVSRAVVTEKEVEKVTMQTSKGRTRQSEYLQLTVRHNPKSTVKYQDIGTKMQEADLPPPLPEGKEAPIGFMRVSGTVYDQTKVGDVITVVNTPYNTGGPEFYTDVRDFKPDTHYKYMALFAALTLVFWGVARSFKPKAI